MTIDNKGNPTLKDYIIGYGMFAITLGLSFLLNAYMPEIDISGEQSSNSTDFWTGFGIGFGVVMLVKFYFKKKRMQKNIVYRDERTNRLAYYSLARSWNIIILSLASFIIVNSTVGLNLSAMQIIIILFIESTLSAVILQQYLYRKGDINI